MNVTFILPQALFASLYVHLFLFMIVYLLAKLKTPNTLDHNIKETHAPYIMPTSYSMFKWPRTDIILFCFLAMATIKFTYSIETVMDINFDESSCLYRGTKLIKNGLPCTQLAPLYAIWYYLLSLFEKDNVRLYYLNYKTLISSTTLAIYVYLRRIKVIPFISVVASFLYLISGICNTYKLVAHFALLVLFLFLIPATFTKSREGYYCVVGLGILAISFARPEYFVSFILFCLVFLFFILQKLRARSIRPRSDLPKILSFLFTIALLLYIFGNPSSGRRCWSAFSQHFSVNYVRWHNSSLNPWLDTEQIVKSVFGNANTIIGCAISNSREFFRHILCNGVGYIRNSLAIVLAKFPNTLPLLGNLTRQMEALFFAVAAIYLIKKRPKISRIPNSKKINHPGLLVLVLLIPPLLSAILIHPKKYYLTIQAVIMIVLSASFISRTITNNAKIRQMGLWISLLLGVLILSLTPNWVSGWSIIPGKIAIKKKIDQERLSILKTIKFIRSLDITEGVNMLAARSRYFIYLDDNYSQTDMWLKKRPFNEFIRRHKINMIILSRDLETDTRFVNDSQFKFFLKDPRSPGFTKLKIPDTKKYLFVKEELLK